MIKNSKKFMPLCRDIIIIIMLLLQIIFFKNEHKFEPKKLQQTKIIFFQFKLERWYVLYLYFIIPRQLSPKLNYLKILH
jgi:hypothetical protein